MTVRKAEESIYLQVMHTVVQRLMIAEDALNRVEHNTVEPLEIGFFETAVLQLRLICELLLMGAASAHLHEGEQAINATKWRPKDVFGQIAKLNEHPLPFPVAVEIERNGQGHHHVKPLSRPLPYEILSKIYGICGDLLHAPTISQVIGGRMAKLDCRVIKGWLGGFKSFVMSHALMLPERKIVLLCIWSGAFDAAPIAVKLEALGPSTFDMDALPGFDLIT